MYTIYKYTNSIDGKVYIGQTSRTIEDRAGKSGYRYRGCSRFYNAILEYGWDAFIPEVIATAETASEADSLEVYYISLYKSADPEFGYNTSVGGGIMVGPANPMYGKKHSEETKQKQRERKLGEITRCMAVHGLRLKEKKVGLAECILIFPKNRERP